MTDRQESATERVENVTVTGSGDADDVGDDYVSAAHEPRLPWHLDEDKAEELWPENYWSPSAVVGHRCRNIYHSTPYHKEYDFVPSDVLLRFWPSNPRLAMERLSMFIQAIMGPPGLLKEAAAQFLRTFTYRQEPENIEMAGVAIALDHVLASNGGSEGTITVAQPGTGYPEAKQPVYFRFQKGVADTSMDVSRYPDEDRVGERSFLTDFSLMRKARRIQKAAASPPIEIELALESYGSFGGGDLGIGLDIRDEPTLDTLYMEGK